jgi:hypothetical protein
MQTRVPKKPPPRARNRKPDNPEQFKRFVEVARKAGVDESGEAFERALEKIIPARQPTKSRP